MTDDVCGSEASSGLLQGFQALGAGDDPARLTIDHDRFALDVDSPHVASVPGRKADSITKLRRLAAQLTYCHVDPPQDVAPFDQSANHTAAALVLAA